MALLVNSIRGFHLHKAIANLSPVWFILLVILCAPQLGAADVIISCKDRHLCDRETR